MSAFGIRVKICGITNFEDAKAAVDLGADAIGFVFAKSPRRIDPRDARDIIKKMPSFVDFVGVFQDAPIKIVEKIMQSCKMTTLQCHGKESPDYCLHFKKIANVIKAFRIKDKKSLKDLLLYNVDSYLLDTFKKDVFGGTGEVFDWQLAKAAKKIVGPIIVSGGLNPQNVARAIKAVVPYGVDVSSGVESRPGKKDIKLMKEFIKAVKYMSF